MSRKFKIVMMLSVILLQLTVLSHFEPLGIIPNYVFVFILAIASICADTESVVLAGFSGLVMDMLTGASIGLNTLIMLYLAILCVILCVSMYTRKLKLLVPMCFVLSFIYELSLGVFSIMLRGSIISAEAIWHVVLPVAVVNSVIFIPVYILLKRVRFEKKVRGIKYER